MATVAIIAALSVGMYEDIAVVAPCSTSSHIQRISFGLDNRIRSLADHSCLVGVEGNYPLSFAECDATAADQLFKYAESRITMAQNASLCLDVASAGKGYQVGIFRCIGRLVLTQRSRGGVDRNSPRR